MLVRQPLSGLSCLSVVKWYFAVGTNYVLFIHLLMHDELFLIFVLNNTTVNVNKIGLQCKIL